MQIPELTALDCAWYRAWMEAISIVRSMIATLTITLPKPHFLNSWRSSSSLWYHQFGPSCESRIQTIQLFKSSMSMDVHMAQAWISTTDTALTGLRLFTLKSLKNSELKAFYDHPEKFNNKQTVSHSSRWLALRNPSLSHYLDEILTLAPAIDENLCHTKTYKVKEKFESIKAHNVNLVCHLKEHQCGNQYKLYLWHPKSNVFIE